MTRSIADARVLRTPDGRYIVIRGRLWRAADPRLEPAAKQRLIDELMSARRAVAQAIRHGDDARAARARVDAAKIRLGERGPVWWDDDAPDYGRKLVANTPYADWFMRVSTQGS